MTREEQKQIQGEATRAGVTSESVGEWRNLARRFERLGNRDEAAKCLQRALEIANTWGSRLPIYGMCEGVRADTIARLERLAA